MISFFRREYFRSIRLIQAALLGCIVMLPVPALASDILFGVYDHGLATQSGQERGTDILLGLESNRISQLPWLARPAFHVIIVGNTTVSTNFAAVGVDWPIDIGRRFYVRPGIGLAYTTGEADIGNAFEPGISAQESARRLRLSQTRIDFGSHDLFEPEIALGYHITPRWAAELSYIHLSNGQILHHGKNQGLDDVGLRVARHF
jgi:lipid A 3-O-deacylase